MNFIRNCAQKSRIQAHLEVNAERIFSKRYYAKKGKVRFHYPATEKALKHFDDFYGGIFKHSWPSVRLALLSRPKPVALLNNFGEIEKTKEILKNDGALDLRFLLRSEMSTYNDTEEHSKDFIESGNESEEVGAVVGQKIVEGKKDVIKVLYPEGSDKNFRRLLDSYEVEEDSNDETNEAPASLHEALSQSQIDTSRVIDPSLGLDSNSLYEYVPVTKLKGNEEYIPEGDYYRFYKVNSEMDFHIEEQNELPYPEHLNVYSYPRGDISIFPHPKICVNKVYDYYPMDGGSILPVLALGLEPGDRVLDMCAAPGGKSLIMLQTMLPDLVVSNDSSLSRCNRMHNVFRQYLENYPENWQKTVVIKRVWGERYMNDNCFNKILVDVPCTTDRFSVLNDDNNIFKSSRTKERLRLPEYQANLLENALSIVEPGGTVVYSTCTLSPIQNDGVVNMALQNVWKNHGVEFTVIDLKPALDKIKHFYRFATRFGLKYGSLVLPFMPINFGPMYFCKLIKK